MNERNREIGRRIREFRKAKGLTQKALGEAIERAESSISEYEKGTVEAPRSILDKIAAILGITASALLGDSITMQAEYDVVREIFDGELPDTLEEMQEQAKGGIRLHALPPQMSHHDRFGRGMYHSTVVG